MESEPPDSDSLPAPIHAQVSDFILARAAMDPPDFTGLTPAQAFELNAVLMGRTVYDDAYFADSLARKVTKPFVMH